MKVSTLNYALAAFLVATVSVPAFSEDKIKDRTQDRVHQLDRDHQADRDMDRDRDRDRDRDGDKDRDRDRDRDRDSMGEKIFGYELMTAEEREQHRKQIQSAESEQQRNEIRRQHRNEMRERAQQKGLPEPTE